PQTCTAHRLHTDS
ncbi:hypothetical protein D022_2984B, partial [Vibrio parahaemolyticus 12310]